MYVAHRRDIRAGALIIQMALPVEAHAAPNHPRRQKILEIFLSRKKCTPCEVKPSTIFGPPLATRELTARAHASAVRNRAAPTARPTTHNVLVRLEYLYGLHPPVAAAGMQVVECASFVAGPTGGLTLAQLGAEVVRIDPLGGGHDHRRWPLAQSGESYYWSSLNKGKRSVAIDLRSPEGQELVVALITAPGPDRGLLIDNVVGRPWLAHDALKAADKTSSTFASKATPTAARPSTTRSTPGSASPRSPAPRAPRRRSTTCSPPGT